MTGHDAHLTRRGVSAAIVAAILRDADAFLIYPYTQTERTVGVMKFCHLPAQGVETYISCDLFQRQWRGRRYELLVAGRVYEESLGYACGVSLRRC